MYALLYLQALGDPAQAFCNFLLFCIFDETLRTKMLKRMFCCQERNDTLEDEAEFFLEHSGSHRGNNCYGSTLYRSDREGSHNV